MTPAYLGLDAGSSTTVALVADATGTILGRRPRPQPRRLSGGGGRRPRPGPETALTEELLRLFGYADVGALLHAFTRRTGGRPEHDLVAAARSVLRRAGAGDQLVEVQAASPVPGALLDALAEGGVTLTQEIHDRVLSTSHPADFLLT